jgi:hypothetical protein
VIFSQSLPGLHVSKVELFVGVAVLIVANTAIVIAAARRQVSFESLLVTFIVRIAVNVALVLVARIVLGPTDLNVGHTPVLRAAAQPADLDARPVPAGARGARASGHQHLTDRTGGDVGPGGGDLGEGSYLVLDEDPPVAGQREH